MSMRKAPIRKSNTVGTYLQQSQTARSAALPDGTLESQPAAVPDIDLLSRQIVALLQEKGALTPAAIVTGTTARLTDVASALELLDRLGLVRPSPAGDGTLVLAGQGGV